MIGRILPRHLEIIYLINHNFMQVRPAYNLTRIKILYYLLVIFKLMFKYENMCHISNELNAFSFNAI